MLEPHPTSGSRRRLKGWFAAGTTVILLAVAIIFWRLSASDSVFGRQPALLAQGARIYAERCSLCDKGLANSRIGIVLVTPALLRRLPKEGIADKELSALLAGERLVPVVHDTTYEALRNVSPLLASRSGLSTAEEPMAAVAAKLAELVTLSPVRLAAP